MGQTFDWKSVAVGEGNVWMLGVEIAVLRFDFAIKIDSDREFVKEEQNLKLKENIS